MYKVAVVVAVIVMIIFFYRICQGSEPCTAKWASLQAPALERLPRLLVKVRDRDSLRMYEYL